MNTSSYHTIEALWTWHSTHQIYVTLLSKCIAYHRRILRWSGSFYVGIVALWVDSGAGRSATPSPYVLVSLIVLHWGLRTHKDVSHPGKFPRMYTRQYWARSACICVRASPSGACANSNAVFWCSLIIRSRKSIQSHNMRWGEWVCYGRSSYTDPYEW